MSGIGETIRKQRKVLGLNQAELAVAVGVNPKTIVNWERGYAAPEGKYLPPLSTALRLRIEDLAGYAPERVEIVDKPSLVDWVTHQSAVLTNGLNDYLEGIITAEARRLASEEIQRILGRFAELEPELADQVLPALEYAAGLRAEAPARSQAAPVPQPQPSSPSRGRRAS